MTYQAMSHWAMTAWHIICSITMLGVNYLQVICQVLMSMSRHLTDVGLSWAFLTSKQSWESDARWPRGGELCSNGSSPLVGSYFKHSLRPGNHPGLTGVAGESGEQWLSRAEPVLCPSLPPSKTDVCNQWELVSSTAHALSQHKLVYRLGEFLLLEI